MSKNSDLTMSRRDLLKRIGAGSALITVAVAAPTVAQAAKQEVRYAMVIDVRRCSGCQACSIACKSEFDVPIGGVRSWVEHHEAGVFPAVDKRMLPRLCNHCSKPPCIDACPENGSDHKARGATYKREEDGIVVVDETKCTGCAKCVEACPYDARFMNPFKGNPELTKGNGAADKCDFCLHRISQGVSPSCVNTCPGRARIFGDLNDPSSEVAKLVAEFDTTVLRRADKTKPSVFYIGADWIESKRDKKAQQFSRVDSHRNERSTHRFA